MKDTMKRGRRRWLCGFAIVAVVATGTVAARAAVSPETGTQQAAGARADQAELQLQAARNRQVVEGKLDEAIKLYRDVIATYGQNRAVAARALVGLGQCYEKLGTAQSAEARKAYEQIISQYADQADAASQARARLAALGIPGPATAPAAATLRRVYEGYGLVMQNITPDGRYAVFTGIGQQAGVLTVRDLVSGAERTIPRPEAVGAGEFLIASLAPDGRQVVYALNKKTTSSAQFVVKVANVDGGNPRVLLTMNDCLGLVPRMSDDGRSVLLLVMKDDGSAIRRTLVSASDGSVLWSMDRTAVEDEWLSPDGRFLAATAVVDGSRILVLIDPKSGASNRLTAPGSRSSDAVWTSDGKGILYISDRSGSRDIWLVRVADGRAQGEPELVKSDVGDISLVRVSREGTLYYWKRTQGSQWFMANLDRTTGEIAGRPAPLPRMQNHCGFDWSPDSSAIAYGVKLVSNPGDESGLCTLLGIRTLADGRERVISSGLSSIRRPKWSPDGKSLLMFGSRDGAFGIYHVDAATGAAKLLVQNTTNPTGGDNILAGTWAPDGRGFYFPLQDKAKYRLMYRDISTGQETERYTMTRPPAMWFLMMSVSRDGSVVFTSGPNGDHAAEIMLLPGAGGPLRTLYKETPPYSLRWTAWAVDGKSVWATRVKPAQVLSDDQELIRIPLDGGEPEYTGWVAAGLTPFPSPDGTRMAVATLPRVEEIWALDDVLSKGKTKLAK